MTEADYLSYFGETAPSNFDRLKYITLMLFNQASPQPFPEEDDLEYADFEKAVLEQIKYFNENPDLTESMRYDDGGASLGKFSEGNKGNKGMAISVSDVKKRLSPNAYMILDAIGYLYQGVESECVYYG